jgi:hypothetical protein
MAPVNAAQVSAGQQEIPAESGPALGCESYRSFTISHHDMSSEDDLEIKFVSPFFS